MHLVNFRDIINFMSIPLHKSVMLREILETFSYLNKIKSPVFVDGTLGLGGHSLLIAQKIKNQRTCLEQDERSKIKIIGIDKDSVALEKAELSIKNKELSKNLKLIHDDFKNIKGILKDLEIEKIDGALLDLGVSSMQLDDKSRGFSFTDKSAPLDMRMNQSQKLNAKYIVNNYRQEELEKILRAGEEPHWKKVASAICRERKKTEIVTAGDLIQILAKNLPRNSSKSHFATDTFRALRLEVNAEIANLEQSIKDFCDVLNIGGRMAIITFHSLEDRIVKNTFRSLANPCTCPPQLPVCVCGKKPQIKLITKKPIIPAEAEIADNPRARSAKLRVVEKL